MLPSLVDALIDVVDSLARWNSTIAIQAWQTIPIYQSINQLRRTQQSAAH